MTAAAPVPAMIDDESRFSPTVGDDGELVYTSSAVCHVTGVTYRQLDYWCSRGWLPDTAHGTGFRRTFTAADVDLIHAVLGLLTAGFTVPAAFRIGRSLTEDGFYGTDLADIYHLLICITPPKERP